MHSLVGCEIYARRSQYILRLPQHIRSHHHVHILYASRNGTASPKVPMVEEISHDAANGSVCRNLYALLPVNLPQSMQLFIHFRLVDRRTWSSLPVPVFKLLQESLHVR